MAGKTLQLFSIFHLNMAFSSIAEGQRAEVVSRCYWPLLRLIRKYRLPFGIEATGYTLETIRSIDSAWIEELRKLLEEGICEFVGSGYAQIIGPLVPADVNAANLMIGHEIYHEILGLKPDIALVNEQAYSCGLIQHYLDAGYHAIVMEWDNPHRYHPHWNKEWRYYPQQACDQHKKMIPVIWTHAIAFQKFQRYVHGEIEMSEYLKYLEGHIGTQKRFFPLYGNDIEIFDFRPGRYDTEAKLHPEGEWKRIERLFKKIKQDGRFELILPADILEFKKSGVGLNEISLESAEQPVPVKKQEKYNIIRWALTGRDDTGINAKCYEYYECLKRLGSSAGEHDWKELCLFFSSDFRTHIEKNRWVRFNKRLDKDLAKTRSTANMSNSEERKSSQANKKNTSKATVKKKNSRIIVESSHNRLILNCNKGLAIEALTFKKISPEPLIGTIPHGFYDDISFGADFFSGHTIIEEAGRKKVTDLASVGFEIKKLPGEGKVVISADIPVPGGSINKAFHFFIIEPRIELRYDFDLLFRKPVSIKSGIVTIIPDSFDQKKLYYKTVNGGYSPEVFQLRERAVNHVEPINKLISANSCLGATEGWVEIGDGEKSVEIRTDKASLFSSPMMTYRPFLNPYFLRCCHSLKEIDDTSKGYQKIVGRFSLSIKGRKHRD
ncbi:MAG: glycoside hydrolase family 57 [Candidatus Omnitrophota bacterium]